MRLTGEGSQFSSTLGFSVCFYWVLDTRYWVLSLHRHRKRGLRPCNRTVERVALDRFAPGFLDQAHQIVSPQALRSGRSRIVVDLFLDHCAVNIVGSEAQRYLRNLRSHHLPVRLNMRKVIKHQPADRNLLDVGHAGSREKMLQRRVSRMKGERNKSLEAASLILQGTQFEQVIDAVSVVFDMAVEHGGVRFKPDLVGKASGIEPLIAVNLVIANNVPHPIGKNFSATAGQ